MSWATAVAMCSGARVDRHKTNAWTPLMYAAKGGHADVTRVLIASGADVHGELSPLGVCAVRAPSCVADANREGASALYIAAREGRAAVVELLLAAGADPCAETSTARTPAHACVAAS